MVTTADAAPAASSSDRIVVHHAADTAAEKHHAADYWTPERMRNARPGSSLVDSSEKNALKNSPAVPAGKPTTVKSHARKVRATDGGGEYYTGGGKVTKTTGKVFFTQGGLDYVCSGSSVEAGNKDLVLTAGHCVTMEGDNSTNFVFVPGYDDGKAPYGKFTARDLTTTPQWQSSNDLNYDVAFAVMNPLNGTDLADAVGTQGIAFNQARGQNMYSFGYPQAAPYDGSDIAWCHGVVVDDTYGGSNDQGMTCNLTGGSSGGPWLISYDEATGVGTLNSLNSFVYTSGPMSGRMFGPYFGSDAQSLYNKAQNL